MRHIDARHSLALRRSPRLLLAGLALCAAPSAHAQIVFTDVTQALGVDYLQSGANVVGSEAIAMTGGAAAGDYDGDGWTDLIVTRADRDAILFRNLGRDATGASRGFEDVTHFAFEGQPPASRSNGVAWGDIDGDGDLDLYVTSLYTRRFHLYVNKGNGRFEEHARDRGAALETPDNHLGFCPSFADYDRDGYLDLYVSEWGHLSGASIGISSSRLLRNLGAANPGHFVDATDAAGVSIEDSVASGPAGTFVGVYAFTARWADFDDDGWLDLAMANDFLTSRLFWNNGDGSFTEGTSAAGVGTDENGMGATVADFDGDGRLDWFVTSIHDPASTCTTMGGCNWADSGNRLYRNLGGRQFQDVTTAAGVREGGWGWGASGGDFDNDGDQDLVMTNGIDFGPGPIEDQFNDDPMKLWRNDGLGFTEVAAASGLAETRSGKGLLTFDFDRDGDLDLFVVHNADHPVLYRNDSPGGHWLQLRLRSAGPNTHGIGARVVVRATQNGAPQVQELNASSNYLGQNEPVLHFGLGAETVVHELEVRWPSGRTTLLGGLPVDRRMTLFEPGS